MPSRVTAPTMFWWGVALLVGGSVLSLATTTLPYGVLGGAGQLGTMVFQWLWSLLGIAQYLGAALVAAALAVRALQRPAAGGPVPSAVEQVAAEPGPYGPGGGHPNPQP
ncbi:hypothetical protein [Cellulomonas cellasea]|uniref:Uncharacterized protein n=1 Tax=Cellulomonas cellasea TaxID=43670 RepID=A0A7W4YD58_9CELL|nr:hypothetical protein [Cellulomonas cellasea]MBB2924367.1 hypothetical protein [Cellulomonas cellasea]